MLFMSNNLPQYSALNTGRLTLIAVFDNHCSVKKEKIIISEHKGMCFSKTKTYSLDIKRQTRECHGY